MEVYKNITIKGDNVSFNKFIYSPSFTNDENGICWLDKKAIQLIDSIYTSFELSWEKIEGAKSYVVLIINYDASRIFGFPFIHWIVGNIQENNLEAAANLSNKQIVQGVNSGVTLATDNSKGIIQDVLPSGYRNASFNSSIGFYPFLTFDRPCMYTIRVFGINEESIKIDSGFFIDELIQKIYKHIVGIHEKNFWHSGV